MKTTLTKSFRTDRRVVRLLSPTGVEGRILKPGRFVECSPLESADLVGRRRAEYATADEVAAAEAPVVVAHSRTAEWVDA